VFGDGKTRPRDAELLREHLEAAGLPTKDEAGRPFVFHSLRHTFSTELEAAGAEGEIIDRMLGHRPATIRGRHYSKPSLEAMTRAVRLLILDPPTSNENGQSSGEPEEANSNENGQSSGHSSGNSIHDCSCGAGTPCFEAPPGRVELPANGLGKRWSANQQGRLFTHDRLFSQEFGKGLGDAAELGMTLCDSAVGNGWEMGGVNRKQDLQRRISTAAEPGRGRTQVCLDFPCKATIRKRFTIGPVRPADR
jgi:Phage integrase family